MRLGEDRNFKDYIMINVMNGDNGDNIKKKQFC